MTVRLSFAESLNFKPKHPERTAKRSLSWDVVFHEYRTRAAMLRAVSRSSNAMSIALVPVVPFGKHPSDLRSEV